ncbi:MAG: hypothetical protein CVU65_16530 [Deltaproteobacteria bacterium HGW-Deltaproteobacteria-22]|jgi:hypothetical protein|nr:MAG: hypothetical protein CVU65_16530 [Deltaproteobacteria bacterium HGW-Deltaproteobacteria-22]
MKWFMPIALCCLLAPSAAIAKVCFACKDAKPSAFVCSASDTFTARKNARKLGCNITSFSGSCKCGAEVSNKVRLDLELEKRYFGWL